jgi:hypothetical protein
MKESTAWILVVVIVCGSFLIATVINDQFRRWKIKQGILAPLEHVVDIDRPQTLKQ